MGIKVFLKETGTNASQGTAQALLQQPVLSKGDPASWVLQVSVGNFSPRFYSSEVNSGLGWGKCCAWTPASSVAHREGGEDIRPHIFNWFTSETGAPEKSESMRDEGSEFSRQLQIKLPRSQADAGSLCYLQFSCSPPLKLSDN